MYINDLLNAFIKASGISKSELAAKTDYAPSAISKMLTQRKFPAEKASRSFLETAAKIFSECIYNEKNAYQLDKIFYFTYDFKNEREMYVFIKNALEISYYKTMRETLMEDHNKGKYSLSWDGVGILNQFCIRLSFLLEEAGKDLDIYSTINPSKEFHLQMWRRIKYNGKKGDPKIRLNQLISTQVVEQLELMEIFKLADILMECFDVYLWEIDRMPEHELAYIPNKMLATYNFILQDMPQVDFVEDITYVFSIKETILNHFGNCITFDKQAMEEYLMQTTYEEIDRQFEGEKYIFSFISMGYLLRKSQLMRHYENEEVIDKLIYIFTKMMGEELTLFASPHSAYKFFEMGVMNYPIVESVHMTAEEMLKYMEEYTQHYLQGKNKLMVIKEPLEYSFCFVNSNVLYLYTKANALNGEKIGVLYKNMLENVRNVKGINFYQVTKEEWKEVIAKSIERKLRVHARQDHKR